MLAAAVPFIPRNFSPVYFPACARALRQTLRARNCTFNSKFRFLRLSLFSFSLSREFKMVLIILRRDLRAHMFIFAISLREFFLSLKVRRCFSDREAPRPPIYILKQQILEYALITRRDGSTSSKVKVATRYVRGEFCKFRYFIVLSGAFNFPLLFALSGRVYGASRTFDKL